MKFTVVVLAALAIVGVAQTAAVPLVDNNTAAEECCRRWCGLKGELYCCRTC
ncbi:MAG: hypothetical protein BYD32DRAFT_409557 [Podila humilis]|nr:MAG: hypothetical protein BYD32DRAFT_409557 [Podila humilis]